MVVVIQGVNGMQISAINILHGKKVATIAPITSKEMMVGTHSRSKNGTTTNCNGQLHRI